MPRSRRQAGRENGVGSDGLGVVEDESVGDESEVESGSSSPSGIDANAACTLVHPAGAEANLAKRITAVMIARRVVWSRFIAWSR